jgi:hypothetical protein
MKNKENNQKCNFNKSIKTSLLLYIYEEAEYVLNIPNTYQFIRPSWDPYIPTKYDIKNIDRFRVSNIWLYIIISLLNCLIFGGIISVVFWYPPARSTLQEGGFYTGLTISILFTILYLATRRSIRNLLLHTSLSQSIGERRFIYTEAIMILVVGVVLLGLQALWKLPFAIYICYFLFLNSFYILISMIIYLIMRLKVKSYIPKIR